MSIPSNFFDDMIDEKYKEGILEVILKKPLGAKTKEVEIKVK